MIVSMKGLQTELYQNQNINPCVGWNIQMHYSFESLSRVRTSLETQSYRCDPHVKRLIKSKIASTYFSDVKT